ncbi:MAG: DUF6173 family protein [Paracoccaceae bacterium]
MENAILPDARAVHADPNAPKSAEQMPLPRAVASTPPEQKSPAQWAYERLVIYIRTFEEQLDGDHEVAMGFAGGEVGVMRIQGIGFFAPDIITFYGADMTGARTQLVQHVSQLNVMLRAVPKENTASAANRIGFRLAAALEERSDKSS